MKTLQQRLDDAIQYGINLQRAIEAHCRGEVVNHPGCPFHAEMLNARLERIKTPESEVARLGQEALDEHFAHFL
jgi:hypothetical protein